MIDLGLSVGQVQNRILGFAALKVFAIPARFWYLLSAELLLVLRFAFCVVLHFAFRRPKKKENLLRFNVPMYNLHPMQMFQTLCDLHQRAFPIQLICQLSMLVG